MEGDKGEKQFTWCLRGHGKEAKGRKVHVVRRVIKWKDEGEKEGGSVRGEERGRPGLDQEGTQYFVRAPKQFPLNAPFAGRDQHLSS